MTFAAKKIYLGILINDRFTYLSVEHAIDANEVSEMLDQLEIPCEVFLLDEESAGEGKIELREPIYVNDTMFRTQDKLGNKQEDGEDVD